MLRALGLAALAGAIAVFSITATEAGGGGGCHAPLSTGSGGTLEIKSNCFGPTIAYIESGGTVEWRNQDAVPHNVAGAGGLWHSQPLALGQSFSHTFDESGIFPYFCSLHPSMVGVVVVGDGQFTEGAASLQASPNDPYVRQSAASIPPPAPVAPASAEYLSTETDGLDRGLLGLAIAAILGFVTGGGIIALAKRHG